MSDKSWKDYFLKSGLPLEYEVKKTLVSKGCVVWDEYSYLKEDEQKLEKEFSYDIDASYWPGGHGVGLMIECKYKTKTTDWLFLPDPFHYQQDVSANSFLHPIDHFTDAFFPFLNSIYNKICEPLGPFCLKGVELLNDKFDETTIFRAINQLSYAFIGNVIESFSNQISVKTFAQTIFLHIPIIITNAELYVCKEDMTINAVKTATTVDQIATKQNFLLFHNKAGAALRTHNLSSLQSYFTSLGDDVFKTKVRSFTQDINHFIDVLASSFPEVVLIMHHDEKRRNYDTLFDYLNFLLKPSDDLKQKMSEIEAKWEESKQKLDALGKRKQQNRSETGPSSSEN